MRFKVSGQNKDSGARMSLEFDAPSKADAERKAAATGMYAPRAEPIGTGELPAASVRAKSCGGIGKLVVLALILIAAAAVYVYRKKLRAMVGL